MNKIEITGIPRTFVSTPNANVVISFEVNSCLTKEQINKALLKAFGKNSLVSALVSVDNEGRAYFNFSDSYSPEISIIKNKEEGDSVLIDALQRPFKLDTACLLHVSLLIRSNSTRIILSCNHMICDGISMFYLIDEIVANLSSDSEERPEGKHLFMEKSTIPVIIDQFPSNLFVKKINKEWQDVDLIFSQSLQRSIYNRFWNVQKPAISLFRLNELETQSIIWNCKNYNVSVNSALTTAFVLAQKTTIAKKSYSNKFIISVDLRKYLKTNPGRAIGYYVSAIRLKLNLNIRAPFWKNVNKVHGKIYGKLKPRLLFRSQIMGLLNHKFIDALNLNRYGLRNDKKVLKLIKRKKLNEINAAFTLTNLGICPISSVYKNDIRITGLTSPVVQSDTMEKYISVTTFNNEMYISVSYSEHIIKKDSIKSFLDKSKEILINNA